MLIWATAYSSIIVTLNILTTFLMAWRIWTTHATSSKYLMTPSRLAPILKILLESAILQSIAEILLLVFYVRRMNAMFILLDAITPLIAITFNTLTIRIKLHHFKEEHESNGGGFNPPTIGSLPMHRLRIDTDTDTPHIWDQNNPTAPLSPSTIATQEMEVRSRHTYPKVYRT
ncbi:hypothetical protein V5O48_007791 [Marasmius crinis-equi]|uniref:Uncharacterized protein n=1 Tax=Marasmius crinis-equi TaxID=585013 RepID=A0ABR3FG44_9AGAR